MSTPSDGFVSLITFPVCDLSTLDDATSRVIGYLTHVLTGQDGRPFCPFVRLVHERNGYSVRHFDASPEAVDFTCVTRLLYEAFRRRSPRMTCAAQSVDVTTVVVAFSHPEAMSEAFGVCLEEACNTHRQFFLDRGLMLVHMFAAHDDPKGGGRYRSAIPLFMVRRMHHEDHVFMKTPAERAAYGCYFDPSIFEKGK